jgi:hypothetical protein
MDREMEMEGQYISWRLWLDWYLKQSSCNKFLIPWSEFTNTEVLVLTWSLALD